MRLTPSISFAFFLALAGYSASLAVEDKSQSFVRAMASRLELGQTVTAEQMEEAAGQVLGAAGFDHHCRSNLLRPALSVVLYNLGRFNQASDYERWSAAHADAQTFIGEMVRCLPADGNVWMRDALVSRAIAEDARAFEAKMHVAGQLMPYEEPQVSARLFIWKRLSPYALSVSEALARKDIRSALLYGSEPLKTSLRQDMTADFKALVESEEAKTVGLGKS